LLPIDSNKERLTLGDSLCAACSDRVLRAYVWEVVLERMWWSS
jgi:hypothetical protein